MSGAIHSSWRAYFPDEASHESIWVGTTEGAPIADVRDPDVAKLIAAAPRLAEALKTAALAMNDVLTLGAPLEPDEVEQFRRVLTDALAALREAGLERASAAVW